MKTVTVKTQIENATVELTNATQNGTRYMLCIGNRRVYTSEDLTVNNADLCWLVNKYYDGDLSTVEVLNKIIMMYNEAEATAEEVAKPEGVTDALGITYKAYEIPETFDAEAVEVNEDLMPEVESEAKAPVHTCKFGVLRTRTVTKFINGELVNTVVSYVDDYVQSYYGKFEVVPRFGNWDGSAQLI